MLKSLSAFPILTTERLTLRQPTENDAAQMLLLRSNPLVNQYLNRKPTETIAAATNFIETVNDNFSNGAGLYWAITQSGSKELIGAICLFEFSTEQHKCEIGYELLPAYHGQGIMSEALKQVIHFAFQTLRVKSIEAFTHKDNQGSNQLLYKLGFNEITSGGDAPPNFKIFRLQGEA